MKRLLIAFAALSLTACVTQTDNVKLPFKVDGKTVTCHVKDDAFQGEVSVRDCVKIEDVPVTEDTLGG